MKRKAYALLVVAGVVVVALGLFLMRGPERLPLPGILIGLGAGALGCGLSGVLTNRLSRKYPDMAGKTVEQQDERNVAISNRAKARAYDLMVYVFGALMITFALMNADVTMILLLIGAYLIVVACRIGFAMHYDKTM